MHGNDLYNLYYNNAKRNYNSSNIDGAKRQYLLATETMLKQAKYSIVNGLMSFYNKSTVESEIITTNYY